MKLTSTVVRAMSLRLGAQSLASLKYLVERGEPYRDSTPLPVAPATC
jgi:hypothetical protein